MPEQTFVPSRPPEVRLEKASPDPPACPPARCGPTAADPEVVEKLPELGKSGCLVDKLDAIVLAKARPIEANLRGDIERTRMCCGGGKK